MTAGSTRARARRRCSSSLSLVFVWRSFYGMRIQADQGLSRASPVVLSRPAPLTGAGRSVSQAPGRRHAVISGAYGCSHCRRRPGARRPRRLEPEGWRASTQPVGPVQAALEAKRLLLECERSFRLNHYAEALALAAKAREFFVLAGDRDKRGRGAAAGWAAASTQQSRYQEAIEHLKQAIARSAKQLAAWISPAARSTTWRSSSRSSATSSTPSGLRAGHRGGRAAAGQRELVGRLLANLGDLYVSRGRATTRRCRWWRRQAELLKAARRGVALRLVPVGDRARSTTSAARTPRLEDYFERSLPPPKRAALCAPRPKCAPAWAR